MGNISIGDYLKLRKILNYLTEQKDKKMLLNNGYSNLEIESLIEMKENMEHILNKLEKD